MEIAKGVKSFSHLLKDGETSFQDLANDIVHIYPITQERALFVKELRRLNGTIIKNKKEIMFNFKII